jgi:hypothetical protein
VFYGSLSVHAGVYLLMRKATDDKEMDEVYIDFDDLRPSPVEVIPPTAPQQPTTAENPPPTSSQGTSSEPPSAES